MAEGNLGRLQALSIDAMGGRVSWTLERLIGAIVSAALVIGGSILVFARLGGWFHILGESMVSAGTFSRFLVCVGALRRDRGWPDSTRLYVTAENEDQLAML
jgi:hypothetical protein